MAQNCLSCKWNQIKNAPKDARKKLDISDADIAAECSKCLGRFKEACSKKPPTCFECAWKDRTLPYEARKLRCKACVEAFVAKTDHDCGKCPWNDPKHHMPTDATLEHCKACVSVTTGSGAMNCEHCSCKNLPESIRRPTCIKCSMRFATNSKVKASTNELSNKGRTIVSYDNHNPNMVDDRDTVTKLSKDYLNLRKSESGKDTRHPVVHVADRIGMTVTQFAEESYDKMKRFLYELSQLTDMQVLLFLSEVKGEKKTDFAKNHNIKDAAVNVLHKQILFKSPVFKDFILLSNGTLEGTRGRKSKDGKSMERIPKKTKKAVYAGVFQPTFSI